MALGQPLDTGSRQRLWRKPHGHYLSEHVHFEVTTCASARKNSVL
jgi:hypothetical protein